MIQEISSYNEWMSFVGLLDDEQCERVIATCRTAAGVKPEIVGEEYAADARQGLMWKVPPVESTAWVYDLIIGASAAANEKYFLLSLDGIVKEPEYVEYVAGNGQFDWHNDYGQERPVSRRKMTVTIQLSDPADYEGGRLEIFDANRSVLPAEKGTVSVFPSIYYHRVTPVTSGVRRALVGWIAGSALV